MAAVQLEEILTRLLVPDNEVIKQATKDLQTVYKDAAIISPLCEVMLNSQNPQIRQYAAVVLRKKLVKMWNRLSVDDKRGIKALLLQCLSREGVLIVLRSVAHLVSTIAKHELGQNQWNELIEFILHNCNSTEGNQREIGMVVLSSLMDIATFELRSQFSALLQLFSAALDDPVNKMVPFYAIKSLASMVEYVGTAELPLFQAMIPKIMNVIKNIIASDEEKACEAMELFDELVECDVGVVAPHLLALIQFCLELASTEALGSSIRVKALSFVSWLITLKKKTLLRHGLLPIIIRTMLSIMAAPGEEEDEAPDEDSSESQSPVTLAGQVLDVLALNLPPEKIYPPVMELVQPLLQSSNKFERSASLVAMAVITEGCSDYIRKNHLTGLLHIVYNAVNDSERVVRNSAMFALGQFAEHLQPDISKFHSKLVPVLIQFMDAAIVSIQIRPQEKTGINKIFYALETFCEHLGSDLLPYLPSLMEKLFCSITTTTDKHVQELVMSAFGAIASACQEQIAPYFIKLIEVLNGFIHIQYNQENSMLQSQAVDTLGTLARTVGEETFRPLAQDCVTAGMALMYTTDPDLRRSVYGMLAAVSCILKEELAPHLDAIIRRMMESLTSEEGVKVHYASFQVDFLDFEEDEHQPGISQDEGVASIEDDDAIEGFSVENAYLEEKEDTCNSLGEIAENVGAHFLPFVDDCYREVDILSEHQSEGIRKAATWTLGKLCMVWYKHCSLDDKANVEFLVNSTLGSFAAIVRTDSDKTVVVSTLETLEEILKPLKVLSLPVKEDVISSLMISIQDLLENNAECQRDGDDLLLPGEEGVAEYDSYLEEAAGRILPPLAGLAGGQMFLSKFDSVLHTLLKKLNGVNSSVADKSFAIGTFAEILEALESHSRLMVSLYQTFMDFSKEDQDDEVCSNSVFGLGVLAKYAMPEISGHYSTILQHLFSLSHSLKGLQNARIMDNICGAICRMIIANQDAIPLDQVLPLLLTNLPLKEDMEENETVYVCLLQLFTNHSHLVLPHLQLLLAVLAQELSSTSKLTKELQFQLVQLLNALRASYPEQIQAACTCLTQQQVLVLTNTLQQMAAEIGTSAC